jgi:hypothetical protein
MDNPDYEDWDERFDGDKLATRARWLTVDRVAELLGMTESEVIAACESGALDSQWNVYEDRSRRYYVLDKEVEHYRDKGPRNPMSFAEAIRLVDEGRFVKRAGWDREFLGRRGDSIDEDDEESNHCIFWYLQGFNDPAFWSDEPYTEYEPWYPTDADKAATDWVEHEIVYRR